MTFLRSLSAVVFSLGLEMLRKVGYHLENWHEWTSDLVGLGRSGSGDAGCEEEESAAVVVS